MEVKSYKIPESVDPTFSTIPNVFVCGEGDYSEAEQVMVNGMAKAINLELEKEVKILQLPKDGESILFSPNNEIKVVFIFGINPKRIGLNIEIKPYRVYKTESASIVLCHKLEVIRNDKTKKMTLWKLLQHIYLNK